MMPKPFLGWWRNCRFYYGRIRSVRSSLRRRSGMRIHSRFLGSAVVSPPRPLVVCAALILCGSGSKAGVGGERLLPA